MLTVVAALIGILIGAIGAAVCLLCDVRLTCPSGRDGAGDASSPMRSATRRRCAGNPRSRHESRPSSCGARSRPRFRTSALQIVKIEERVLQKEEEIDAKLTEIERREQGLGDREVHAKALQEELKEAKDEALLALERLSGLTVHEAKQQLLERSTDLVRHELAREVRQMEEEARADSRRRARALVADSLQRVAASHTAEATVIGRRARIRRSQGTHHRT